MSGSADRRSPYQGLLFCPLEGNWIVDKWEQAIEVTAGVNPMFRRDSSAGIVTGVCPQPLLALTLMSPSARWIAGSRSPATTALQPAGPGRIPSPDRKVTYWAILLHRGNPEGPDVSLGDADAEVRDHL